MKKIILLTALFLFISQAFAQYSIKGKITSETGEILVGANIKIANSYRGTMSSKDGNYELKVTKKGLYKILVSYLGYESKSTEININNDETLNISLKAKNILTDEVIVAATRAAENTPLAYTNIDKEEIVAKSSAKDIPFLLQMTPSLVSGSDAGAGVGYTSLSIRGSDISRINVTINGVPLNDPESHGVYWVDIPDFASSLNSIQIQRGVGTSTNGAGAFGANINMQTTKLQKKAYLNLSADAGSFNTQKEAISFGTGLLHQHFTFDARLSELHSDGFIDRAFTNMTSYFLSAAYYGKKSMLRINHFAGHEKTYQAWWGVPKVRLENDEQGMQRYEDHWLYSHEQTQAMMNSNSRTYNYYTYDNETDNYWQQHYQLIYSLQLSDELNFNVVGHYTHGEGYYEQYKTDRKFADYNVAPFILNNDTISKTNLIQRKWLDNDFYGLTYNFEYKKNAVSIYYGGAWNQYFGGHFGNVIWAEYAQSFPIRYKWYDNTGVKTDFNNYFKTNYELFSGLNLYADIQFRQIGYKLTGNHDDLRQLQADTIYNFINPKAGVFYQINDNHTVYASYSVANREPSRNEFRDAEAGNVPKPETLYDLEAGYKLHLSQIAFETNFYYMDYENQLVNTGKINNVGSVIKENVAKSYRAGVEFIAGLKTNFGLQWNANLALSRNKIENYSTFVDNWDDGKQVEEHFDETNISFSPDIIAANSLKYELLKHFDINIDTKYVGRQYIDNTSSIERSLHPYLVNNLQFTYHFKTNYLKNVGLNFSINNLLDEKYETNAWAYRYILGGEKFEQDGYFTQAGRNYMFSLKISL